MVGSHRERVTALIVVLSLGIGSTLAVLAEPAGAYADVGPAIIVFGWFVVAPLYYWWWASRDEDKEANESESIDPLTTLKQEYAEGRIDEEEFDRRLDRLVELEGVEIEDQETERERERKREREPE